MQRLEQRYSPSIQQMTGMLGKKQPEQKTSAKAELSFQEILHTTARQEPVQNLKFSKHANERLATRNINLSSEQMERLETGTTKAREKGIQESLVMVDNLAFIVNVKNNTVITAMDDSSDSIFTNIDGAVIS
ncbi:MAG: TIGR02530 family flagellar biosynthesis protein [Eubacteriales bacterium]|nr:TIGR02530 family flagellar biosynthesis protein [Eubacteriales bacterium]